MHVRVRVHGGDGVSLDGQLCFSDLFRRPALFLQVAKEEYLVQWEVRSRFDTSSLPLLSVSHYAFWRLRP